MAESAEDVYARVVEAVGEDGRFPMPDIVTWDIFPWEVVDGQLSPKVLQPPTPELARGGDSDEEPCRTCQPSDDVVWHDDNWRLAHFGKPSGLPLVLLLTTKEHLDYGELDDDLASEHGRIANRIVRIVEGLDNIGRVHVNRWGDGGSHFHQFFFARTAGMTHVRGSTALEWDDIIPPGPVDVWRDDLAIVAAKLANWGGEAVAQPR